MSEDREKKIKQSDEEQLDTPDVEAHKKAGRLANDDDGGDDVQAHKKAGRLANDDDGGDDVDAHVKLR